MASVRLIRSVVFLVSNWFIFVLSLEQYSQISSLNLPVRNGDSRMTYDHSSCTAFFIDANQLHIMDVSEPERPKISDQKLYANSLLNDVQFCDGSVFVAMTTVHFRPQSTVLQYSFNRSSGTLIKKTTKKVSPGYKKLRLTADCTLMSKVTDSEIEESGQGVEHLRGVDRVMDDQRNDMVCIKNGQKHVLKIADDMLSVYREEQTDLLTRQKRMTGTKGYNEACGSPAECKPLMTCTSSQCKCIDEATTMFYNTATQTCNTRDAYNTQCRAVDNSCLVGVDLFCDTTLTPSKCQCNSPKVFNPSNSPPSCEDKIAYGATCIATITNHCQGPFVCLGTPKTCQCPDETATYRSGSGCLARIGHNLNCDTSLTNCITTLTCKDVSGTNKCQCSDETTHYFKTMTMTCETRQTFGTSCQPSPDSCITALMCNAMSTTCKCAMDSQYFDGTSCAARHTFDVACITNPEDSCELSKGLTCNGASTKCACSDTEKYWDTATMTCVDRIAHAQTCTPAPNDNCRTALTCMTVTSMMICQCANEGTMYYDTTMSSCVARKGFDEACQNSPDACSLPLTCQTKCRCPSGQYWDGSTCSTEVSHDASCVTTPDDSCLDSKGLICSGTPLKCVCSNLATIEWDGTTCSARKNHDDFCVMSPDNCISGLVCTDMSGTKKCECAGFSTTMYYDTTLMCRTRHVGGETCQQSQDSCYATRELYCNPTTNKCECQKSTEFYSTTANDCVARHSFDQTCQSSPDSCMSPLTCQSSKCNCPADQYWNSATCVAEVSIGAACVTTPDQSCLTSKGLECTSGTCSCVSSATKAWDGLTCSDRKVGGQACQSLPEDNCYLSRGLTCDSVTSTCKCSDSTKFYSTTSNNCIAAIALGGMCNINDPSPCLTPGASCIGGTCSCNADMQPSGNICEARARSPVSPTTAIGFAAAILGFFGFLGK